MAINDHYTDRSRFTRECFGKAVAELMQEMEFDKIRVSHIAKRAGFSRMTFYQYYQSKEDVLIDYLHEIVAAYIRESEVHINGQFRDEAHVLQAILFFDRYADYFRCLVKAGMYGVIIDAVNHYMEEQVINRHPDQTYVLYAYAGALLNVFLKWEENGKTVPAQVLARALALKKDD
ncbi:MAG: TetR/AcrR family transcriptional regulator [Lachnospiraceae bacterium]|nr:TetR/AcrR family transcriptional regulator [Lachnospiraceae bacterium]